MAEEAPDVEGILNACLTLIASNIKQLGEKQKKQKQLNSYEGRTIDGHTRTLLDVLKARKPVGGNAKDMSLDELRAAAKEVLALQDRGGDDET